MEVHSRGDANQSVAPLFYLAAFAFVALHLLLVVFGASGISLGKSPLVRPLQYYAALTGADSRYGFFAPGVGTQVRISVELRDADGFALETNLPSPINREASLRVGNVVGWFLSEGNNPGLKRSLAASWAGKALGRSPVAAEATVRVEKYRLVSSKDFLSGKQAHWEPYYDATFRR